MLMSLLSWILFGLFIGAIARLLIPGDQGLGIVGTVLVGIVGSFIGGFIGYLISGGAPLQSSGIIGAIVGAVALLLVSSRMGRQSRIEA